MESGALKAVNNWMHRIDFCCKTYVVLLINGTKRNNTMHTKSCNDWPSFNEIKHECSSPFLTRAKSIIVTEIAAAVNSSSSNSNSPISLSKISTSTSGSGSGNSSRRNRKVLPVKDREYDPEKHCGVRIGNMKPCTRSLTCKTHQISLRRNVEGRSKPFDQLLADHRNNAKDTHKHSTSKQVKASIKYLKICITVAWHSVQQSPKLNTIQFNSIYLFCRRITRRETMAINYWNRLATAIHRPVLIWNEEVSQVIVISQR